MAAASSDRFDNEYASTTAPGRKRVELLPTMVFLPIECAVEGNNGRTNLPSQFLKESKQVRHAVQFGHQPEHIRKRICGRYRIVRNPRWIGALLQQNVLVDLILDGSCKISVQRLKKLHGLAILRRISHCAILLRRDPKSLISSSNLMLARIMLRDDTNFPKRCSEAVRTSGFALRNRQHHCFGMPDLIVGSASATHANSNVDS